MKLRWLSFRICAVPLTEIEPPVPDNSTTPCFTNSIIFIELIRTTFPSLVLKFSHPFPPNTSTPLASPMGSPWAARWLSGRHLSFHIKKGKKVVILYSAEVLTLLLPATTIVRNSSGDDSYQFWFLTFNFSQTGGVLNHN